MNKIDIDRFTETELIDLNHRIVERLRFLQQVRDHRAMLEFGIGDRVAFDPPGQPGLQGVLIKYNKKTVTVLTDDGRRWNVAPGLLRRAPASLAPYQAGEKRSFSTSLLPLSARSHAPPCPPRSAPVPGSRRSTHRVA